MKKTVLNKEGSILAFVLVMSAIMITVLTTLLSTVVTDYKMKKINSHVKKIFYSAESGLDEAYIITLEFLSSALEHLKENSQLGESGLYDYEEESLEKRFKDIILGKSNEYGGKISLKKILEDKDNYIFEDKSNLTIEVEIKDKNDYFYLIIDSRYKEGNIYKKLTLLFNIIIPANAASLDNIYAEDLIQGKTFCERR